MDVEKALRELHEEKRRLDGAIAALEARLRNGSQRRVRRGRKSMSPAERLEVSRRMSKYWEARRAASATALPVAPSVETEFRPKAAAAAASSLSA